MVVASVYARLWQEIEAEITGLLPPMLENNVTLLELQHCASGNVSTNHQDGSEVEIGVYLLAQFQLRRSADPFVVSINEWNEDTGRYEIPVFNQGYVLEPSRARE